MFISEKNIDVVTVKEKKIEDDKSVLYHDFFHKKNTSIN